MYFLLFLNIQQKQYLYIEQAIIDTMHSVQKDNPNIQQLSQEIQPHIPNLAQAIAYQQKRDKRLKHNIQRILTPVQRLQSIPLLRLDQGVLDSVKQQFISMCVKISYVLLPRNDTNSNKLRNWDLWGPFLMVVIFALFVDSSQQLMLLFFSIFIGAFIVTFNVVALGGKVSFFQSFAILSYCIFPIFMSLMVQRLLRFFQVRNRAFSVIFQAVSVLWSIISVYIFIGVNVAENKKFISVFPAALYYIFIGLLLAFN